MNLTKEQQVEKPLYRIYSYEVCCKEPMIYIENLKTNEIIKASVWDICSDETMLHQFSTKAIQRLSYISALEMVSREAQLVKGTIKQKHKKTLIDWLLAWHRPQELQPSCS